MSPLTVRLIRNANELLQVACEWNSLWERAFPTPPVVRAEGIVDWLTSFDQEANFIAIVVEVESRFVAALPLVKGKLLAGIPVTRMVGNSWSDCGNLLVEQDVDPNALKLMVQSLMDANLSLLAFEGVPVNAPQWQLFQTAIHQADGLWAAGSERPIGVIDILGDWEKYRKSWSGNHRSATKRSLQKLEKEYSVRAVRYRALSAEQLQTKLESGFEVEDRSWKGDEGTSVLKSPGMLNHFQREAKQVHDAGCLDLWFLYADDRPIAFEYCQLAHSICWSNKMGYDREFAKYGPGRILRYFQLQELHTSSECKLFDTFGLFDDSKAKWSTRTYSVENAYIAISPLAKRLVAFLKFAKGCVAYLRNPSVEPLQQVPIPGASGLLKDISPTAETMLASDQPNPINLALSPTER